MTYAAPVSDLLFNLEHIADLAGIAALPGWQDANLDTAQAVLEECARFSEGAIAPLNRIGDIDPSALHGDSVHATPGFAEAYRQFVAGGWQGLQHPVAFGGQDLPKAIGAACAEMFHGASLSFALCPMLTDGAIEALLAAASPELRERWLPPLVEGRWTGTMNLTEPQAGSDLSQVRSRAEPQPDGSYRISGTKIFITWGEHDMADNIVHLVLARLAGAPEGVKGISLFLVPKFLLEEQGRPAQRNDVRCVGLEHKLGIRASPTAVLQYGDGGGALGFLVGQENRGLETMFVMMNSARYAVGIQGIAIAERARQQAEAYAAGRIQGRPAGSTAPGPLPIAFHPDVRRMLDTMAALTEGCRALAAFAAACCDRAARHPDADERSRQQALYEFLVPVVKGFATESGIEVSSLALQVHGGMGYIEETGAAQHYRDARILTIYEGTTAIQANDLLGRKTLRDGGATARELLARIAATEADLAAATGEAGARMQKRLQAGRQALADAVEHLLRTGPTDPASAHGSAVSYLMLAGCVLAGWQMARALLAAQARLPAARDAAFLRDKIGTASAYAAQVLPRAQTLRLLVLEGGSNEARFQE